MSKPGVVIAVLAGGRGSRLGGTKPLAELAGRPLLYHVLDAARGTRLPVCVVAKRATPLPHLDEQLLIEPDQPHHPLAGVLAALRALPDSPDAALLAVGCDTPFLTPALLSALAACDGAAALAGADGPHPLPARIPRAALDMLQDELTAHAPLRRAIAGLHPRLLSDVEQAKLGDPARLLVNVNDAESLAAAERMLSRPPARSAPPPR